MIPYEQYAEFVRLDERGVLDRFERLCKRMSEANAVYMEGEVEADLKAATKQLRKRNANRCAR
jgi:hypothetical protein